jgi:hypothetical protein
MATLDQLRDGYNRLNNRLIKGGGEFAKNLFLQLGSWRDEDIARYYNVLGPQLQALKMQAARLQVAYYQQVAKANEQPFTPAPISTNDVSTETIRNGATFQEVYRRPFASMYAELATGALVSTAINAGAQRAMMLVATDVQLASRQSGFKQRMSNDNIQYYRRTLTGAENCALCAIASTQRYRRGNLKPIHPGCDCGEEPFYGDEATPLVLEPEKLDAVREQLWEQLGVDDPGARDAGLAKVTGKGQPISDFTEIIVTREHGEYGATLAFRDHNFTTVNDLPD